MKLVLIHLMLCMSVFAGGGHKHGDHDHHNNSHGMNHGHNEVSHHDHHHGGHAHDHEEKPVHNALLKYRCKKMNFEWKQLSSDPKKCPICASSDSDCGKLVQVLPRKSESYKLNERLLPNKICPVSKKPVDRTISTGYKGHKIYFHNPFNKKAFDGNPELYIKHLQLNPVQLGKSLVTHSSHFKVGK